MTYFVFQAPILGPVVEFSGGLGDLILATHNRDEAERAGIEACKVDSNGHRHQAWLTVFDCEKLEVGESVYFGE